MFENFDIWYNNLGSDDDRPFVAACRDREVKNDERWVLVSFTVEEAKKFASIFKNKYVFTRRSPNKGSFFFCAKIASSFTEINGYLKGVKGVWTK